MTTARTPPALAERLLEASLEPGVVGESIVGDAREEYLDHLEAAGRLRADLRYWRVAVSALFASLPRRLGSAAEGTLEDVRLTLRSLRRTPAFAATAVATLGLGIGGTTAMVSVIRAVLLEPLPYAEPERLVTLWSEEDWAYGTNLAEYLDIRARSRTLADIAVYQVAEANLTGGDQAPERGEAVVVTGGFFDLMGVPPQVGRLIDDADDRPGVNRVTVLSHSFWIRRFGGDPGVLGRTLFVDDDPVTVVGVMPASFTFPNEVRHWGVTRGVDLWMPFRVDPSSPGGRGGHGLQSIARLEAGVSIQAGSDDVRAVSVAMHGENPEAYPADFRAGWTLRLASLSRSLVRDVRSNLLLLFAAGLVVLLVAVMNVANLLLVRGSARQREMALRTSLGAGTGRIVRQLMTESLTLSLVAASVGILVAYALLQWILGLAPPDISRLEHASLDAPVLAFTVALAAMTGLASGTAPAWYFNRNDLPSQMRAGRSLSGRGQGDVLKEVLVAAQLAVTLLLVTGAGLVARSFVNLNRIDLGFETEGLLTFEVTPGSDRYPTGPSRRDLFETVVERIDGRTGVRGAGAISTLPLSEDFSVAVMAEGMPPTHERYDHGLVSLAAPRVVTTEYMTTVAMQLTAGRLFTANDGAADPAVAIIADGFAAAAWPGEEDVLGRRVAFPSAQPRWHTVVGVVRDTREQAGDVTSERYQDVYFPLSQVSSGRMSFTVKAESDPLDLVPVVREVVASIDPNLIVHRIRTMDDVVSAALLRDTLTTQLMLLLAVTALALGAVGIYAVVAFAVSRRAGEVALRIALGAPTRAVVLSAVGRGMRPVLAGWLVGLGVAVGSARLVEHLLFGVSATDGAMFATASALLLAVGFVACYVPARRTASADPADALAEI